MKYLLAALTFAFVSAAPALAANNIYVNITSSSSNCATSANSASGHFESLGYFPASTFNFGGSTPSPSSGVGAGGGKLSLENLSIGKPFDECSAPLITEFLQGSKIPSMTLIETDGDLATSKIILSITLTNAMVVTYQLTDATGGGIGQEVVAFSYQTACISSNQLAGLATGKEPAQVCYNASTNQVSR